MAKYEVMGRMRDLLDEAVDTHAMTRAELVGMLEFLKYEEILSCYEPEETLH